MVAVSFQSRFVAKILAGSKRSTIRRVGKGPRVRPGTELQLYTGQRTPDCRLLMRVPCATVSQIVLTEDWVCVVQGGETCHMGVRSAEMVALAAAEGFDGPGDMLAWFRGLYGLPTPLLRQITWDPGQAFWVGDSADIGRVRA